MLNQSKITLDLSISPKERKKIKKKYMVTNTNPATTTTEWSYITLSKLDRKRQNNGKPTCNVIFVEVISKGALVQEPSRPDDDPENLPEISLKCVLKKKESQLTSEI